MIIDMPTSATALAGMEMSKQFEKIMIDHGCGEFRHHR